MKLFISDSEKDLCFLWVATQVSVTTLRNLPVLEI